jgi:hypothetical protein
MSTRDTLRSAAFKSKPRKRSEFTYEGNTFEIISPTVGQYTKIVNKGGDSVATSIWAIIFLTVLPGTTDTVFEDTDYDTFLGQSLDGFMLSAQDAITTALSRGEEEGKD